MTVRSKRLREKDAIQASTTSRVRSYFKYMALSVFLAILSFECTAETLWSDSSPSNDIVDPLPSWNDNPTKDTIIGFVESVSQQGGKYYLRPEERIAVFNHDGTLMCEKPAYPQVMFGLALLEKQAETNPALLVNLTYKDAFEGNFEYFEQLDESEAFKTFVDIFSGTTQADYEGSVQSFLKQAEHPRFNVSYTETVYHPMIELLSYLRANNFRIFVVTGGDMDFVRVFSEGVYGIPPENVCGSSLQTRFEMREDLPTLIRLPKMVEPLAVREGKPVNIQRYIGRKPILAVGDSDSDIQMLQFTNDQKHLNLSLLIHHDDAQREYAYDARSQKALTQARKNGWPIISIKNDWKAVFLFPGK
jgi:phosphoglycolate phosphatase-like HAD superfamily hydrolase